MTAGLPGTGLGGLLYLLLVVLMPVRECWFLITGRSSAARWKTVARMGAIGGAIVLSIWGEGLLLARGFKWLEAHASSTSFFHTSSLMGMRSVIPTFALAPFVVLAAMIVALHVLRWIANRQSKTEIELGRPPTKISTPEPAAEAA